MYNAKPLSIDDAFTWNYFRPYIVDNYNRLVAGGFNATDIYWIKLLLEIHPKKETLCLCTVSLSCI